MFDVRQGTSDDFATIKGLIQEAADWLQLKGTDQWARPWPSERKKDQRILRSLRTGRTWLISDEHGVIATITCHPDANKWLWRRSERKERAVYVSRLIVSRYVKGQQIGTELINWTGKWARLQYGAEWVRIDVWTTNRDLRGYYERQGFQFQRISRPLRYCFRYPSGALFQKPTAGLESCPTPRLLTEPALKAPEAARPAAGIEPGDQHLAVPAAAPARYALAAAAATLAVLASAGSLFFRGRRPGRLRPRGPAGLSAASPWPAATSADDEQLADHKADLPRIAR
ncbi:MAG TPA: GNAT family N-acetyltransferase [Streptosporangiaceae bacterium]|jgi:RimJ/RimL family protein N-acetyltransferase